MIRKVFKGFELNEKDNLWTSAGKGFAEGTLTMLAVNLTIAGAIYMIGKTRQGEVEIKKQGE